MSTAKRKLGDVAKMSSMSLRQPPPPPPPPTSSSSPQSPPTSSISQNGSGAIRPPPPPPMTSSTENISLSPRDGVTHQNDRRRSTLTKPESVAPSALLADIQARRRRSSALKTENENKLNSVKTNEMLSDSQQNVQSSILTTTSANDESESFMLRRRLSKSETEKKALMRKLSVVERLQDSERQKLESDASTKVNVLREENETLLHEIEKLTEEKTLIRQRCEAAERELGDARIALQDLEEKLRMANNESTQLKEEMDRAKESLSAEETDRKSTNTVNDDIKEMEDDFNTKLKILEEELSIARRAVAASEARYSVAEDSTDKLNAEVMRSRGESIIVANKLRDVMEALEGVKLELEDEREQNEELKKKLKDCEDALDAEKDKSNDSKMVISQNNVVGNEEFEDLELDRDVQPSSRKVSIIDDFIRPVAEESVGLQGESQEKKEDEEEETARPKKKKSIRRQSLLDGMMATSTKPSLTTISIEEDERGEEEDEGEEDDTAIGFGLNEISTNRGSDSTISEQSSVINDEVKQLKSVIQERDLDIQRLESTISALQPIQVEINSLKIIIDSVGAPIEDDIQETTSHPSIQSKDNLRILTDVDNSVQPILATPPRLSPSLKRRVSMSALSSSASLSSPMSPSSSMKGVRRSGKQTIQDIDESEGVIFTSMLKCGWLLSDINDNEAMQALVKRASIMHFEQGQKVIERGFIGGGILAVSNGKLSLQDIDGSIVAIARQGDIIGESSIALSQGAHDPRADENDDDFEDWQRQPFNIVAEEASSLFVLTVMDFESGLKLFPRVRHEIAQRVMHVRRPTKNRDKTGSISLVNFISRGGCQHIWSSNNQVKDATAESIDSIVRDQEAILKLAGTRVEEFAQSVTKWRKKCYDIKKKALEHVERTSKDSIKWTEKVRVLENENEELSTRISKYTSELENAKKSTAELKTIKRKFSKVLTDKRFSMPILHITGTEENGTIIENGESQKLTAENGVTSPSNGEISSNVQNREDDVRDQPTDHSAIFEFDVPGSPSPSLNGKAQEDSQLQQHPVFTPAPASVPGDQVPAVMFSQISTLEKRCELLERTLFQQQIHDQTTKTLSSSSGQIALSNTQSVYLPGDQSISKLLQLKDLLLEVRGGKRANTSSQSKLRIHPTSSSAKDVSKPEVNTAVSDTVESVLRRDRLVDRLEMVKMELHAFCEN